MEPMMKYERPLILVAQDLSRLKKVKGRVEQLICRGNENTW